MPKKKPFPDNQITFYQTPDGSAEVDNTENIIRYKNRYRIESARLKNWDYGWNGAYFVTICTKNRVSFFGNIISSKMIITNAGLIAEKYWHEIPAHFPFVSLGAFIVMPNHIHGIVIIDKKNDGYGNIDCNVNTDCRDAINRVFTVSADETVSVGEMASDKRGGITGIHNPMINDNLSKIIRWYKGRTSFESRKIKPEFAWQSRFYDHIIRDDESYNRISEYIIKNSTNWKKDDYYDNL